MVWTIGAFLRVIPPFFILLSFVLVTWIFPSAMAMDDRKPDKNNDNQVDARDLILLLKEWREKDLTFGDILPLENKWQEGVLDESESGKVSKTDATPTPTKTNTRTFTATVTPTETTVICTGAQGDPYGYIPPTFTGAINKESLPGAPTGIDIDVAYIERRPRLDFDSTQPMPVVGSQVTFRAHINNRGTQAAGTVGYQWNINGSLAQGQNASGTFNLTGSGDDVTATHHTQDYVVTWTSTPFDIGISCTLQNGSELYSQNNSVTINSHSAGIGYWAHESFALYFLSYQRDLGIGSNSMEDFLQRMCAHYNYILKRSIYPSFPDGIPQKVHLDYVKVVSDPSSMNKPIDQFGNLADTKSGDGRNKTVDFIWGGQFADVPGNFIDHTSTSLENIFFYTNATVHEMLHALLVHGVDWVLGGSTLVSPIDSSSLSLSLQGTTIGDSDLSNYIKSRFDDTSAYYFMTESNGELIISPTLQYSGGNSIFLNLDRGASGTTAQSISQGTLLTRADCRIVENNRLVSGSDNMPFVEEKNTDNGRCLCDTGDVGTMGDVRDGYLLSELDSHVFSFIYNGVTRLPVSNRNFSGDNSGVYRLSDMYNFSFNGYWKYLYEVPTSTIICVVDNEGQPVVGADVDIYRSDKNPSRYYAVDWFPEIVDGDVDIADLPTTDENGEISLSFSPFGIHDKSNPHIYTKGRSTAICVAKVAKGSNNCYIVCRLSHLSRYYWRNQTNGTSHPGVLPLKVDWSEDATVNKVLSCTKGSSVSSIDSRGNFHTNTNSLKFNCVWGSPTLANIDQNIFTDENQVAAVIRLRNNEGSIIFSIDENLVPCLRASEIELHTFPQDYEHVFRVVSNSGNVLANFDPSGSVVLKGDLVN